VPAPRPLVPEKRGKKSFFGAIGSQAMIVGIVGLVLAVSAGLLVFAWYDDAVRPRRELALRVGDTSYSMEYFANRYRQAIEDPANLSQLSSGLLTDVPQKTLDAMESDAILLQRAAELGITAGQNEIDREMLVQNNIPVITNTPEGSEVGPDDPFTATIAMQNAIRARLQDTSYSLEEYREIAHARLLRDKVQNYFKEQTPARAPQTRIRVLQFPTESDARTAIELIKSGGATFAQLAEEKSLDQAGKGRGGERDWLTRGILPPKVDEAAFSLPLNTLSEPIDAGDVNGFIVIEVLDRADERDVSDTVRAQLADQKFNAWLDEQRSSLNIERALTEDKISWAWDFADPSVPQSLLNDSRSTPSSVTPSTTLPSPAPGTTEPSPQPSPAASPTSTP
jgi:parvulin-like peptidyl-prolyl isomerase